MQRVVIAGVFAAIASKALAGVAAPPAEEEEELKFVDQTWKDVTEGDVWDVKWSKGNGNNVALAVKNATWEYVLCGKS